MDVAVEELLQLWCGKNISLRAYQKSKLNAGGYPCHRQLQTSAAKSQSGLIPLAIFKGYKGK
ncbi:hypothetical protein LguiA_031940 [Lonicera macranthoides]